MSGSLSMNAQRKSSLKTMSKMIAIFYAIFALVILLWIARDIHNNNQCYKYSAKDLYEHCDTVNDD